MCPENTGIFSSDSPDKGSLKALDKAVKDRFQNLDHLARMEVETAIKRAINIIHGEDFRNPPSIESLLENLAEFGLTEDRAKIVAQETKSLFEVFGRFSDQDLKGMAVSSESISSVGVTYEMKRELFVSDSFMENILETDIGLEKIVKENERRALERPTATTIGRL